jgi:hypothetical protein
MSEQRRGDGSDDGPGRADRVGEELKAGFAALSAPEVPDEVRPRWHARLIAITNSAKHDLSTAEDRLARYWQDWEAEVGPRPATSTPRPPV